MRNIIIMGFALVLGASVANAHGKSCLRAENFLKFNKAPIEALLNEAATGHLQTLQEVGKIKLGMLEKAVAMKIPFICKKVLKKTKKIVGMVAWKRAMMPAAAQ